MRKQTGGIFPRREKRLLRIRRSSREILWDTIENRYWINESNDATRRNERKEDIPILCSSRYSSPRVRRERTFEGLRRIERCRKKRRRKKQEERRNRGKKRKRKKKEFSGLSFARSTSQKCRIGRFRRKTSRKIDLVSCNQTNTRPTTRSTDFFRWKRWKFRFCHFSSMIIWWVLNARIISDFSSKYEDDLPSFLHKYHVTN